MQIVLLFVLFFAVGMWAKNVVYEAGQEAAQEISRIQSIELGRHSVKAR